MNKFKRRYFLVDKKFQFYYAFIAFFAALCVGGIVSFFYYQTIKTTVASKLSKQEMVESVQAIDRIYHSDFSKHKEKDGAVDKEYMQKMGELLSRNQQEMFYNVLWNTASESLIYIILIAFILFTGTLFLTFRIVGPLYRVQMLLREVQRGNLNVTLSFRKNDRLQSLAGVFNELFQHMRDWVKELEETTDLIKEDSRALESNLKGASSQMESLKHHIKKLINLSHRFSSK